MKNFITVSSVALGVVCALALANAQDNASPGQTGTEAGSSTDTSMDQSGATGTTGSTDQGYQSTEPDRASRATLEKKWRNAKSCTDENGVIYRRGNVGFDQCVQSKIDQLGGTAGSMNGDMSGSQSNENPNDSTSR